MKHSYLYTGSVTHNRKAPVPHSFTYNMFMVYLDLDELEELNSFKFWSTRTFAPARFKRKDFMGPHELDLAKAVRRRVYEQTGFRPKGPVRMLTHLRYFGLSFNPVTFYYCFDPDQDDRVQAVVAEITNTPWGERHSYVLLDPDHIYKNGTTRHQFRKDFHVSPFMPMEQDYVWFFSNPGQRLQVHMQNLEKDKKVFDVSLSLIQQPMTQRTMSRVLLEYPLMTWRVMAGIYSQAFKLWAKNIPFHSHPNPHREFFVPGNRRPLLGKDH